MNTLHNIFAVMIIRYNYIILLFIDYKLLSNKGGWEIGCFDDDSIEIYYLHKC